MRFIYCDAYSFKQSKLQKRLVAYCRDHLIDCVFISGDFDEEPLKDILEKKLAEDHVILFNKNGRIEINGIRCELKDTFLIVEEKAIAPLSGCISAITVLDGTVKSEYICLELFLDRDEDDPEKQLEEEIDRRIEELMKKLKGKKERKFN